ncbi:MAG: C25 family cysteine peptidase [Ignavibacteria bacterium]
MKKRNYNLQKTIFTFVIYLILPLSSSFPQKKINEIINNHNYQINIKLEPAGIQSQNETSNELMPKEFGNKNSEFDGLYNYSKDLFVAIPYNTNPKINIELKSFEKIPDFQNADLIKFNYREQGNFIVSKGYLWIGNNYCLHLKINPYKYDGTNGLLMQATEVKVDLLFNEQLPSIPKLVTNRNVSVSDIIINQEFASLVEESPKINIQSDDSWIDYSKNYLKTGTAQDGIYRITYNDLSGMGISPETIDPNSFQIWNRGTQIPIFVSGNINSPFTLNDYIEFVGQRNMGGKHREVSAPGNAYNEYLGRYTDTTIYWLTWGGAAGKRVRISNGSEIQTVKDTVEYYNDIIHVENNNWFDFSMADITKRESPYWYDNKTWIEGNLGVGNRDISFNLTDVFPDKNLKLFAKLQDYASDLMNKSHLLSISLNDIVQVYDSGYVNKYQQKVLSAQMNSNLLKSGGNFLRIHSYPTSASLNLCVLDWSEIEYPRYINLTNRSLSFPLSYLGAKNERCIKVGNAVKETYSIWKTGDIYTKYITIKTGDIFFIKDTLGGNDKFAIADSQSVLTPRLYYVKKFKNLRSPNNEADYIAITNKAFSDKVNEYCDFIARNYKVKTVNIDINDIYDEFDYGQFNPESIRDFLKTTQASWKEPQPKYVFLIGDANFDYFRNVEKRASAPASPNYVPSFGTPVSDNWFVIWDSTGANIPQMNIGRLPVRTNDELNSYLLKHKKYLSKPYDDWNKKYLFFSGGNFTDALQIAQFKNVNNEIINSYVKTRPIGGLAHHFYKTTNPVSNFGPYSQEEIKSIIEQGGIFVSYIGHSGTQTWDNSITDPSQLNSLTGNPLITDFGCSTARFAEPDITSFAELFVNNQNGQAIAYIGNASLGFTSTAQNFPALFYGTILKDSVYNISEALKLAKVKMLQKYGSSGVYSVFSLTNTLIGDPIIRLPIPTLPNLSTNNKDISMETKTVNDQLDSIKVKFNFRNLGKVTSDTIQIIVKDEFSNLPPFERHISRIIPMFDDSISIYIPIKNKSGEHKLSFRLDPNDNIKELNETDNYSEIKYVVSNSALRALSDYETESQLKQIIFLNPVINSNKSDQLDIQTDKNKEFNSPGSFSVKQDSFYTKIKLDSLQNGERFWLRAKLSGSDSYNNALSFIAGSPQKYNISDSLSFASLDLNGLKYSSGKVYLDTVRINFRVISAGFNDGNTAVIEKNAQNFIPENTVNGHHVCLFDSKTYDFKGYYRFNISNGGQQVTTDYIKFLDTLSSDYLVLIAVSDEGVVSSTELKSKLKGYGSRYIDSLQFRSSWAMIGYKGATIGSVPESFNKAFGGRVEISQPFVKNILTGGFYSNVIGKAAKWKSLSIQKSTPLNSSVTLKVFGIKSNGGTDSLAQMGNDKSSLDLNGLNAVIYSQLKVQTNLTAASDGSSPVLNSLGVDYLGLPELGVSYRTVNVSKDTIRPGENIQLNFNVYNAGESPADSFNVKVEVIKPDNSRELICQALIDSIFPESKRQFQLSYNTADINGQGSFYISIDPENKISELYKDNNFYSAPFFVLPDTTHPVLKITFDGNDIMDGEYVSPNPKIKVELSDNSFLPVTDTTSVRMTLNDKPLYYSTTEDMKINYSASNPKVVVDYTPTLSNSQYTLKVFGKNTAGNITDSAGVTKTFEVINELKLLDLYNYPNPFKNDTYFTFKLTRIPDELKIKIYTVAGRMIRDILVPDNELKYDFNKIHWNGRDEDGDLLANGTYIYKVISKKAGKTESFIQKLSIIR